ncbi:MAG TPA: ornithine cyclodeaminase family protein [candidate division Zixibacteria bacterium]|nr:ornithine cyclodeaminase family protein [candidate division Zixibacteria bacterium]
MLILSNEDIEKLLPVGACLEVLEQAYRDLGNGLAATVPRYDVFSPTKPGEYYEYKTMSGVLPNRRVAALRLNSSVVKWYEKAGGVRKDKLPAAGGDRFVGLVMLFSTETGEPLAIFPDGYVQKLRVAAASAIAARHLARRNSRVMALLGAGWQASAHLAALCAVRELGVVRVYSPTPESRRRFVDENRGSVAASVEEAASVEAAIDGADIVTCATNSISAVFSGDRLQPGVHVSCVKPCELDATAYRRADPLIIHWREAKPFQIPIGVDPMTIPDISDGWLHPLTREHAPVWDLPTIADLVNGRHPGRTRDDAITCFCNNVGLGLQFAAVGSEVLARAREAKVGREIPTDWFLESVHP